MNLLAISSGFGIGAVVGMTGVGGGSLMTPLLLSVFRLTPAVAIGTDLCFAALTKLAGAASHQRAGNVDRRVVALLLGGSLPGAAATLAVLQRTGLAQAHASVLTVGLGIALILTAAAVILRPLWQAAGLRLEQRLSVRRRAALTIGCGAALGVLVTLSSVGAGAIGACVIMLLHPRLEARRVVGTDIAHAVPLTLLAALGHASLGHVEWNLLGALLIGSVPGIWLGARLTRRLPERLVRAMLCASLLTAGLRVIA